MSHPTTYSVRWPRGFRRNPLRFIVAGPTWKAMAWALVLAVVAVPLLIATILLVLWIPLVARVVDEIGAAGGRWMGVDVHRHRAGKWLDVHKFVHLACQLALSLAAFLVWAFLASATVVFAVTPLVAVARPDLEITFGNWATSWLPSIFAASWGLALVSLFALAYLSWLIAGASVYAAAATTAPTPEDLRRLEESRAVLIDAFTGERSRIERELHDGVQQYLTALQLNIATAELKASHVPELDQPLEQAKLNARRALESLRQVIRGIYPQVLADKGLIEALRELLAHSGVDGELTIDTDTDPDTTSALGATPALLLYHCAAEGITNAVRHGGAGRVDITVRFSPNSVSITVDDAGSGLSPSPDRAGTRTGVAGLRERASALGGTAWLDESTTLGGASLHMSLPVAQTVLSAPAGTPSRGRSGRAADRSEELR